jgi:YggT family protein
MIFYTLAQLLAYLVHLYSVLLLVYCILSWFPQSRYPGTLNKIYTFLQKIVNPYLSVFRRVIPPIGGTIDISPIIAMLVLEFATRIIISLLYSIAI